jgi:ATP-dependent exoDNAse (exonuclease V) beta subunit
MSNKEANQALYVAMTRPRNKLVMFSELKEGEFLTEEQKENMVPTGESLQPEEITSVEEKTQKNTVSSAIENQIEELIKKGIIKSKCD